MKNLQEMSIVEQNWGCHDDDDYGNDDDDNGGELGVEILLAVAIVMMVRV
jgi:hypothetical protein